MTLLQIEKLFESIPESRWTVEDYSQGSKRSALGWLGVNRLGDHRYMELFKFRTLFTSEFNASISEIEEASLTRLQKLGYNPKTPKANVLRAVKQLRSLGHE
jgi:hypothetical protein